MNHKFIKGRALDEGLRALYEEKGKLPDMRYIEHKRRHRTMRILFALVIFLAILITASWAGFFIFGTQNGGGEVKLDFQGPQAVVSGVSQEITLRYKNLDRDPLAFAMLQLRAPENLVITQIEPRPDQEGQLKWNLGTLTARSSYEIHLTFTPYGVENDELDLQALFTFKPANFNAEFQTSATHKFTIRANALSIAISGPSQATPGEELAFNVVFKNVTDTAFENLQIALNAPLTFSLNDEYANADKQIWEIVKIDPGEEKEFIFKGSFLSNAEGPQNIVLEIKTKKQENSLLLAQGLYTVQTSNTGINLSLIINESPQLTWIGLGQDLNFRLSLANLSQNVFEDIKIILNIKGALLDWTSAKSEGGAVASDSFVFPQNKTIALQSEETQDFKASLKTAASAPYNSSPFIEIFGEVRYGDNVLRTLPVKLIVVSDLRLAVQARYFDANGSQLGSGPLPPRVNEETKYQIRFNLKNTFHDLSNITVTANVPKQGRWLGRAGATTGKITFNETTNEVRWEIPRLPVTMVNADANFDLGITPTETDRGKLSLLLGIARASALDTITQVTFSTDAPPLSSNIDLDPLAKGKGVVQ